MDTLDGSSGFTFTYLPIAFEDDCQVCECHNQFVESSETFYEIEIEFLDPDRESRPSPTSIA